MGDLTLKKAKYTFNILGEAIKEIEVKTDDFVKSISFIEKHWPDRIKLLNFYKASVQLNLMALDYCAAFRQYLNGTTFYEERYAIKNLIVISKETYKRLYGFNENARKKGMAGVSHISARRTLPSHTTQANSSKSLQESTSTKST